MRKAIVLAIGTFLIVFGVQCLGVETFHLRLRGAPAEQYFPFNKTPQLGPQKTWAPPNWMPWSLMGTGAIICLYTYTLPKHMAG
jgi:hypothetical protein